MSSFSNELVPGCHQIYPGILSQRIHHLFYRKRRLMILSSLQRSPMEIPGQIPGQSLGGEIGPVELFLLGVFFVKSSLLTILARSRIYRRIQLYHKEEYGQVRNR